MNCSEVATAPGSLTALQESSNWTACCHLSTPQETKLNLQVSGAKSLWKCIFLFIPLLPHGDGKRSSDGVFHCTQCRYPNTVFISTHCPCAHPYAHFLNKGIVFLFRNSWADAQSVSIECKGANEPCGIRCEWTFFCHYRRDCLLQGFHILANKDEFPITIPWFWMQISHILGVELCCCWFIWNGCVSAQRLSQSKGLFRIRNPLLYIGCLIDSHCFGPCMSRWPWFLALFSLY